jgi:O-antigen/teichoic acid export membrane protein
MTTLAAGVTVAEQHESDLRGRERHRRALLASAATLVARGSSLVTLVVSVPLVLHSVGPESFGVWLTLASFVALLGFADLGLGNGLVNAASHASGKGDHGALSTFVASTFYMLVCAAALLGLAFAAVYAFVPWADLVNAHSLDVRSQVAPAVAGLVALVLIGLPLRVADRLQTALQQGFYPNLWLTLGNVLGLGGLALAVSLDAGLPWLVCAPLAGPLAAAFANCVALFGFARPDLLPIPSRVARGATRRLVKLGLSFFVLQVAVAVAYQSDTLVIAQVLGPEAVQEYAVPMRLFIVPTILLGLVLAPLWPAYSEAIARGDRAWVLRTFRRTLVVATLVGIVAAAILAIAARPLIHAWVGNAVKPSVLLIAALTAWLVVTAVTGPISMFLNGANVLGPQVIGAVVMMAANLGLSIVLAQQVGVSGVVWGTVAAQIVFFLLPAAVYTRRSVSALGRPPVPANFTGNEQPA